MVSLFFEFLIQRRKKQSEETVTPSAAFAKNNPYDIYDEVAKPQNDVISTELNAMGSTDEATLHNGNFTADLATYYGSNVSDNKNIVS